MKKVIKLLSILILILILTILGMFILDICPPNGPWPMPPWCSHIDSNKNVVNPTIKDTPDSVYNQSLEIINKPGFQKGVTFGAMSWKEEDKKLIDDNIKTLKEFNVKWAILIPDWFVFPGLDGTEIKPYYDAQTFPNPSGWITPTLTDDELTTIIKKLNKEGINVILKPHIDPIDFGVNPESNREALKPADWDLFFENYKKFILHYAQLAENNNVPIFVIGTELNSLIRDMPNSEKKWRDLIKEVRAIYSGKLTYSVSCFDKCLSPSEIKFWDALDYIGFEPYFGLTNKNNPSVEEMKQAFDKKFNLYAKPLYEKYGKKILLTEANIYSKDGANQNPLGTSKNQVDYQEQADYYEAMFESVSGKDWIEGIYWWGWYLGTTYPGWDKKDDLSDSFVRKPAGQVMKFWYYKIKD